MSEGEDRKTVLLKACRDMLVKCRDSYYVLNPMEASVFYDGTHCDGYCLLEDIEFVLNEEQTKGEIVAHSNHECGQGG